MIVAQRYRRAAILAIPGCNRHEWQRNGQWWRSLQASKDAETLYFWFVRTDDDQDLQLATEETSWLSQRQWRHHLQTGMSLSVGLSWMWKTQEITTFLATTSAVPFWNNMNIWDFLRIDTGDPVVRTLMDKHFMNQVTIVVQSKVCSLCHCLFPCCH